MSAWISFLKSLRAFQSFLSSYIRAFCALPRYTCTFFPITTCIFFLFQCMYSLAKQTQEKPSEKRSRAKTSSKSVLAIRCGCFLPLLFSGTRTGRLYSTL